MSNDVFVLIPGLLGSVLEKDGDDVFAVSASAGFRALFSGGRSIADLRLRPTAGADEMPGDGVVATRIAPDAHLIPGLWKIDGYGRVGDYLQRRLGAVPGESYFEFPYDWRLDNRIAARRLRDQSADWLAAHRTTYPDAKLVLVAHSMGGLVSRYFLEVFEGWRDTRALITFGTPYRGSLNALDTLGNGIRKLFGLVDLTDVVRSFPSIHQLLPIYRCVDEGSDQLSYVEDAAPRIPELEVAAVAAARTFHREIEEAVATNRVREDYRAGGYRIHRVVGIEHPTSQSARLGDGGLEVIRTYESVDMGGDGTVPRVSASPLEANSDEGAMFAGTRHASLQNADAVLTQLRGWLSGVDLSSFRAGAPVRLSLDMEDVHPIDEGVRFTVTPSAATAALQYRLDALDGSGVPPLAGTVPMADGPREVVATVTRPGCYRLSLSGVAEVEPVSDLLIVAPR